MNASHRKHRTDGLHVRRAINRAVAKGRRTAKAPALTGRPGGNSADRRRTLRAARHAITKGKLIRCWVCEDSYAVTTHEGHAICNDCLDHFLGGKS